MRALLRLTLVLAIFFAAICPAWCLLNAAQPSHACCHGKSAGTRALPQAATAPVVPAVVHEEWQTGVIPVVFETPSLTILNSESPLPRKAPQILRL